MVVSILLFALLATLRKRQAGKGKRERYARSGAEYATLTTRDQVHERTIHSGDRKTDTVCGATKHHE